mmetsp:Transcript_114327/g.356012  ORF Transcript_114327/g.356012 Transcript_114327/m.356012 type:complete len:269 (+) Transcript_114327:47-853(+)
MFTALEALVHLSRGGACTCATRRKKRRSQANGDEDTRPGAGEEGPSSAAGQGVGWDVTVGPLSVGDKGVQMKPQMKLGVQVACFKAEAGVDDVRNGLKFDLQACAELEVRGQGQSLDELHDSIRCDTPGFREALQKAKQLLGSATRSGASAVQGIAEALGMERARLESSLNRRGSMTSTRLVGVPFELVVQANTAVGFSAEVRLGWRDVEDYRMVGAGGRASAGIGLGAEIFCGKHHDGSRLKLILGIGNFRFEYVIPIVPEEDEDEV